MPGSFEHISRGDAGSINLKHIFLQNKVIAPKRFEVILDGAANGPEIIEPCHTPINIEGGGDNKSALQKII